MIRRHHAWNVLVGPSGDFVVVDIHAVMIAYYRFDWIVQELADYGRRAFRMPDLGEETRAEAVGKITDRRMGAR